METIRRLKAEEFKDAVSLSDQVFRDKEQMSMGNAFPHVYSSALDQAYGAFCDDKLVSFIGLVPHLICVHDAKLHVFSLGAVSTAKDYRNKGYSSRVLAKAFEHANLSDASLILVSGDRGLYQRANCFPFGSIYFYQVSTEQNRSLKINSDITVREMCSTDWFAIKKLIDARKVRYEQSIWDLANLLKSESFASCNKMKHKIFVSEENGNLTAFLIVGKKMNDSSEALLIEWAGDEEGFLSILSTLLSEYRNLRLPIPWYEERLVDCLNRSELTYNQANNAGTIHIVNSARLFDQLRPYLMEKNQEIAEQLQVRQLDNGDTIFSYKEQNMIVSPSEFVDLVFNSSQSIKLDAHFIPMVHALFPIPFPFTQGLNFV